MNTNLRLLTAAFLFLCGCKSSGSNGVEGSKGDSDSPLPSKEEEPTKDVDSGASDEGSDAGTSMPSENEGEPSNSGTSSAGAEPSDDSGSTEETSKDEIPACPYTTVEGDPDLSFELVGDGFERPVFVAGHPRRPNELHVAEQYRGRIQVIDPTKRGQETMASRTLLELEAQNFHDESGFLGFAFHPNYPEDPRVFVNFNPTGPRATKISEFQIEGIGAGETERTKVGSERELLSFSQPYGNHNGGMLAFGPDGYLYIGTGDGGSAGDPDDYAQDKKSLFGKMLRIGVDPLGDSPYSIPADNPFFSDDSYLPEIWALGLRNPWRYSFDSVTGYLYAGDVGQNRWEEIDIIEKGKNYGWRVMEADHCFEGQECETGVGPNKVNRQGYTAPIAEIERTLARSITGGYVYRSCEVPAWQGYYFFADYVTKRVWRLRWDGRTVDGPQEIAVFNEAITSFGSNAWGDVYITTFGNDGFEEVGRVYRLVPKK